MVKLQKTAKEERGSETKVGRNSSGFRRTAESETIKIKRPEKKEEE